jgi:leader peptidase (prepilin peptidase)/N-methyltransferase
MTAFVVLACSLFGLAVGSFLNVVIWRVPRHESVVAPPSHCPGCDTPISPRDNVPVLSWLALRGRCRTCGAHIPIRYPMVEVGCAVLWGVIGYTFADSWALPAYLLLASALLALSVIDLEHYLLPNRIVFPVAGAGLVLLGVAAFAEGAGHDFVRAVLGGLAAFAALGVLHLISPRGMGMGDVKLAFVLGLYLGWLGWGEVLLGLFLGFLLGALIGVALIATKLRTRKDHVPFGPFLAAGTLIAIVWGPTILAWYSRGQ